MEKQLARPVEGESGPTPLDEILQGVNATGSADLKKALLNDRSRSGKKDFASMAEEIDGQKKMKGKELAQAIYSKLLTNNDQTNIGVLLEMARRHSADNYKG